MLCSLYGGRSQGFFATILSCILSIFVFIRPDNSVLTSAWIGRLLFFVFDCSLITLLCSEILYSRKRAQKALGEVGLASQAQKFLDSVIEHIPNMIFVKDAKDLRFVRFNKAGEELLGLKREDLIGKNDYDLFPKDQADFFTAKDREVLRGRNVVDIAEEPLKSKFGIRLLHTKKIPLIDQDGNTQYLLGISEDITERKEAEKQRIILLQEQAARAETEKNAKRLRLLADVSVVLSETLDPIAMQESVAKTITNDLADWCIIDTLSEDGKEIRRVSVHSDPEKIFAAKKYQEKYPINTSSTHQAAYAIRSGKSILIENVTDETLRGWALDEEHYQYIKELGMYSMLAAPMKYYGKIIGAITLVSTKANRHYDDFDLSVVEDFARKIALALENAKLFVKAQEASQAKSAFLANMSHEIRTPLGAMLGFAELLATNKGLQSEHLEYLSIIVRNGRQLLRIIDEILDLSKIESEAIRIENIEFSLPQLINEISALLSGQADQKNIKLAFDLRPGLPEYILSDPTRLRQILINVVGNAIKFTEKGEVVIAITAEPGSVLKCTIQDTGIGISKGQALKLFQPFAQADDSTTRKYGGTGLGLFLSKKLAKLLGGDLILENSEQDKGSTFTLTIKYGNATKPLAQPNTVVAQGPASKTDSGVGRILIVDDVADNRALLKYQVSRLGFAVDLAESGQAGIEKALTTPYEVMLMDIQMPDMDGFEAVSILRRHKYDGVIIAVTAYAMKGDREKCLESGFDDYLCKPIDKDLLEKIIFKYSKKEEVCD